MYATWEDYNEKFLIGDEPSMPQSAFPRWEQRARTYLDKVTFNRLYDPDTLERYKQAVIMCTCELAEYYSTDAVQESKGLTAHSVSGQSKTYDKQGREEKEIVRRYLGETGLLYAGVR